MTTHKTLAKKAAIRLLQMKNSNVEMIKLWNRIDDRVDIARERICDLEDIAIKVLQNRKPKGRRERASEARGQRQIASCPHPEVFRGGGDGQNRYWNK